MQRRRRKSVTNSCSEDADIENQPVYQHGGPNARAGNKNTTFERTVGENGIGEEDENGQQLVEFCSEHGMVITLFHHKDIHKYTWASPDNNTKIR